MEQQASNRRHELRSEEVEDILGRVPSWITRNGMILFALFIAILFAGLWLFRFPKVRTAEIIVTSMQPPADIRARADGKIDALLVDDNEKVKEGQVLAVIENPADMTDVLSLEVMLDMLESSEEVPATMDLPVNGEADLGDVQDEYAIFHKNYRDYMDFIRLDYHRKKIALLEVEYDQYIRYSETLKSRSQLLEEEYRLAERQFRRDSLLYEENVLSESAYEDSHTEKIQKEEKWKEVQTLAAENDIRIAMIRAQILDMELREQEQSTLLRNQLEASLNNLKASIGQWKKDYLIIAPVDGSVTFTRIWSENQNVHRGDRVMTVVPDNAGTLVGKISLPIRGAGDVRPGQQVNIMFDNYPYMEYGRVKGIVRNVSRVPEDDRYAVEVSLPDGLRTYYDIDIEFHQNMEGVAEILTDKIRLIERIFNPVRSAISRQKAMKAAAE